MVKDNSEAFNCFILYFLIMLVEYFLSITANQFLQQNNSKKKQPSKNNLILQKIKKLKAEKEIYNCPSEFARAAKIEREITKLTQQLTSEDSDHTPIDSTPLGMFNSLSSLYSSRLVIANLIIKALFILSSIIFTIYYKDVYLNVRKSELLSYFFKTDSSGSANQINVLYCIFSVNYLKSKLRGLIDDIQVCI